MPQVTTLPLISHTQDWREQLRNAVSDGPTLLKALELGPEQVGFSAAACADFSLRVPHAFIARMQKGNPSDPLLLQVVASGAELLDAPGYSADPTGEIGGAIPQSGIVHKYQGRLLLIVAGGCAINCRYCFRRHFPYGDNINSRREWQSALDYVAADESIGEVILSGGDPLVADDDYLAELIRHIAAIPHVRRLRVHSRLPVVIPDRVTAELLSALTGTRLQCVMVVHCNHANEIDAGVNAAFGRIRQAGITLLNQSVLLRGINDSTGDLIALSEALFASGALPYYLHLLDKVAGAAHFDLGEERARALHRSIAAQLPGYLLPKLVREIHGEPGKTLLSDRA